MKSLVLASVAAAALSLVACGNSGGDRSSAEAQSSVSEPELVCVAKNDRFSYKIFNLPSASVNSLSVEVIAKVTGKSIAVLTLPESKTRGRYSTTLSGGRTLTINEDELTMRVTHQIDKKSTSTASCR